MVFELGGRLWGYSYEEIRSCWGEEVFGGL
jgi:hypothetical protein